jgi:hypothetical protein
MIDKRYLVIPSSITSSINYTQIEGDIFRLSIDGEKTIVKYDVLFITSSFTQSCINPVTNESQSIFVEAGAYGRPDIYSSSYNEYNHSEIITLLNTPEWFTTGSEIYP